MRKEPADATMNNGHSAQAPSLLYLVHGEPERMSSEVAATRALERVLATLDKEPKKKSKG
jgi:hypothetical protein